MMIACPDCGTLQVLPELRRGDVAVCGTCRGRLERINARGITAAWIFALITLLLLFPANLLPLFEVRLAGQTVLTRAGSGVFALFAQGWVVLPVTVAIFALLLPFVRYALLALALGYVRLGVRARWVGSAFRWSIALDRWAMPEVFLVACAVGYSRVAVQASVIHVGAGGYALAIAAMMAMLSRALLDRRTVWRAIAPEQTAYEGQPVLSCTVCDLVLPVAHRGRGCPRCGLTLRPRRTGSWERTWALVIAGALLYIPANIYPMSVTRFLGITQSYRIIDGVTDLFYAGLWPLGVILFCASLAIPIVKLLGLSWCLLSVGYRSDRHLVLKTRTYRLIDEVGRWSSIDPFIISVLVPLMHYRGLLSTEAGAAATAFIAVVVITMFASSGFDPRLLWDAAVERRHADH
jgi:paraquat-inducible protein A